MQLFMPPDLAFFFLSNPPPQPLVDAIILFASLYWLLRFHVEVRLCIVVFSVSFLVPSANCSLDHYATNGRISFIYYYYLKFCGAGKSIHRLFYACQKSILPMSCTPTQDLTWQDWMTIPCWCLQERASVICTVFFWQWIMLLNALKLDVMFKWLYKGIKWYLKTNLRT